MPIVRRHGWRRFRPQLVVAPLPYHTVPARKMGEQPLIEQAVHLVSEYLKKNTTLDRAIDLLKNQLIIASTPVRLVALALLLTPQASRAQAMMDAHKHNFHDRKARLFELIDFNDSFVAAVLSINADELDGFSDAFRSAQEAFAKKHKTPLLSEGQWHAIEHGLSREVAVYFAALHAGYEALMTSRVDDAFGVDMQVRDRATGSYVNIDCKTHSSFFFRLKELVRERRLTPEQAVHAQDVGYCEIENCRDDICVKVVLLRIDHTILGDIVNFRFVDERATVERLAEIIGHYGLKDGGYGKMIAPL